MIKEKKLYWKEYHNKQKKEESEKLNEISRFIGMCDEVFANPRSPLIYNC